MHRNRSIFQSVSFKQASCKLMCYALVIHTNLRCMVSYKQESVIVISRDKWVRYYSYDAKGEYSSTENSIRENISTTYMSDTCANREHERFIIRCIVWMWLTSADRICRRAVRHFDEEKTSSYYTIRLRNIIGDQGKSIYVMHGSYTYHSK